MGVQHVHKIMRGRERGGEQIRVHPYSCWQENKAGAMTCGSGERREAHAAVSCVLYALVTEGRLQRRRAGRTMIQKCDASRQ